MASTAPSTIAPEFTTLLAAIVRAVSDLSTQVVRKAYSGTTNMPPAMDMPSNASSKPPASGWEKNSATPISAPLRSGTHIWQSCSNTTTNTAMTSTASGE